MKINIKDKKILIPLICIVVGVVMFIMGIVYEMKDDKLGKVKDAIENVFFYLPEQKYEDLNAMSDYCKISLVYGTDYLKSDALLSKDDYDTVVKKKKNAVKAYSKDNMSKAIKSILGENASINYNIDEEGEFPFTVADECQNGNDKIKTLSFNESKGYIFSIDDDEKSNDKLFVRWDKPIYDGDTVTLRAKALLAVLNGDGDYDIYADSNLEYKADTVSKSKLESKIKELYDYKSMDHIITLKKQGNDYIWTKYEVIDNVYHGEAIY